MDVRRTRGADADTAARRDSGSRAPTVITYRGVDYHLELSEERAAELDAALSPYLRRARRAVRKSPPELPATSAQVRQWARANGYLISDRGRISERILAAFEENRPNRHNGRGGAGR